MSIKHCIRILCKRKLLLSIIWNMGFIRGVRFHEAVWVLPLWLVVDRSHGTGTWGGKINMTWGKIMINWNPWGWATDCFGLLQPPIIQLHDFDNSGNLQKKLVPLDTILNFYLAHESVKMKQGIWMGTDGVVSWTTAPHLQGESVTTSVSWDSVSNQPPTWKKNTKNIHTTSALPSKSTQNICGLH